MGRSSLLPMAGAADRSCEVELVNPVDPRIERAVAGDRSAAESLVRELLPRVRNLVRYLVRGDADVDDMAQLGLLAVLRGLHTFRGEGSFHAWADRIVVREALGYVKRRRAKETERRNLGADLHSVDESDRPDAYLARRRAVEALDALPDEQRTVLVLHHVVGLSVPELAEELGLPFETARSRLRLGMAKLRGMIDDSGESSP